MAQGQVARCVPENQRRSCDLNQCNHFRIPENAREPSTVGVMTSWDFMINALLIEEASLREPTASWRQIWQRTDSANIGPASAPNFGEFVEFR